MFSLVVHASMKVTSTVLQKIYNQRQLVILIFLQWSKNHLRMFFSVYFGFSLQYYIKYVYLFNKYFKN